MTIQGLKLDGMTCAWRVHTAEWAVKKVVGVSDVAVNFAAEKAQRRASLQAGGSRAAFVGEEIDDARPLLQADLGPALAEGVNVPIDSVEVGLARSDLESVPTALGLERSKIGVIHRNLFWLSGGNVFGIAAVVGVLTRVGGPPLKALLATLAVSLSSASVLAKELWIKGIHAVSMAPTPLSVSSKNIIQERSAGIQKILTVEGTTCQRRETSKALTEVRWPVNVSVDWAIDSGMFSVHKSRDGLDPLMTAAVEDTGHKVVQIQKLPA